MAQKFILTDRGDFRLGDVGLHKELLGAFDECYGGGFYEFDYTNSRILLYGASYDFGLPQWDRLQSEGATIRIPSAYRGMSIIYTPDDQGLPEIEVTRQFKIRYV